MTAPESPAATLRRAAGLMRERATAARDSAPKSWDEVAWMERDADWYAPDALSSRKVASAPDSIHIATFASPAVALAVADWLETDARVIEDHGLDGAISRAYTVATTYLQEHP